MTKAIIYARVSTDKQRDENASIPEQIQACMKFIQNKGYSLVGNIFIDKNTGKETDHSNPESVPAFVDDYSGELYPRPGTNAALDYYDNSGGFDVMVVKHRDRYTRSNQATYTMDYDFTEVRGVKVEFVDGFQNDETPEGYLTAGFIDLMSEYENIRRAKRCKDGKLHYAKEKKKYRGGGIATFGYSLDMDSLGGLKIDNENAEIVKRIFHLYVMENYSIRGIADYLNNQSIMAYKGDHWGKTTIHRILTNKTYIGSFQYNRRRQVKNRMTKKIKIIERNQDEWVEIPCPAIIEKNLFQMAQDKLKNNKVLIRQKPKRFYMMSGMVFCKDCGRSYISQTSTPSGRRKRESQSYRHRMKEGHCKNHSISAERIESMVWEDVKGFLLHPEILHEGYYKALEKQREKHKRDFVLLDQIRKRQEIVKTKKQNLLDLRTDPEIGSLISNEDFSNQWKEFDFEMKENVKRIQELEDKISIIPSDIEFNTLEKFANEIQSRLDDSSWKPTPQNKRKIFELLHLQVNIFDKTNKLERENIEIKGWFDNGLLSPLSSHSGQKTYYFVIPEMSVFA